MITLEAIADDRLYLCHAFFGIAGWNNYTSVFELSTIVASMANKTYPLPCQYNIDNVIRIKPYWLSNWIYPKAPCFLHFIVNASIEDESYSANCREGRRKDIERTFAVLQAKFHIISLPSRLWSKSDIHTIMYAYIILYNMFVNDKIPLVKLPAQERNDSSQIIVADKIECCFVRDVNVHRPIKETIAALCATRQYLYFAFKYVNLKI